MTKSTEKVNKTQKIELRVTPYFKSQVKAKAEKAGLTVSAWVEKVLRRAR